MAEPCDTIFIGDLPGELTEAEFKSVFGAFGTVTWSKIWKGGKGGKQAALVEFSTVDEATWVVENVNGNIPEGLSTPVMVKYKEERSKKGGAEGAKGAKGWGKDRAGPYSKNGGPSPKGGKGGYGGKGGKGEFGARELVEGLYSSGAMPGGTRYENDENAIYINGLPKDATDETLYQIFSPFGAIAPKGVRAMMDPEGGCKGFGFVNYLDNGAAQTVISTLNGAQMPDGTTLTIKTKGPSSGKKGGKGGPPALKGA